MDHITLICVIIGECHYFDQNRPDSMEPIVNKTPLTPKGPFTVREIESVKIQAFSYWKSFGHI